MIVIVNCLASPSKPQRMINSKPQRILWRMIKDLHVLNVLIIRSRGKKIKKIFNELIQDI
jgi:hypothetical protein